MIAYVESNFVVELAREQEEASAAEKILRLAERRAIQLAFPVFSLCEPFSTLTYRDNERRRFVDALRGELWELGRIRSQKKLATDLRPLVQTLLSLEGREIDALENIVQRMLSVGRSITLDAGVFTEARALEKKCDLSPQDAIVYACVLTDLQEQQPGQSRCFISRNSKDFDDPSIIADLAVHRCRYMAKFQDGLAYNRSEIR
jgi:hypothetical protein